jgi:hypothetical protein
MVISAKLTTMWPVELVQLHKFNCQQLEEAGKKLRVPGGITQEVC